MAIDFPTSPSVNDTLTVGNVIYTWDGTKWTAVAAGGGGATDKIEEGNTSAEVIDTGSDGRFVVTTEGTERLRVNSAGEIGLAGANYGTSGQVLTSGGTGAAPTWSTPAAADKISEGNTSAEVIDTGSDGRFVVTTEGTERARIDSSGRLGIGDTAPDALLTVNGVGSFGAGSASAPSIAARGDLNTGMFFPAADTIAFAEGGSEAMRIDSSSRLLVGTTSQIFPNFGLHVVYPAGACAFKEISGVATSNLQVNWHTATSSDNRFIEFGTEASYTIRGSITYNRGGGITAYNTTSDYRAKILLGDVENTGQTIDALKVYRGVMNGATVERPMLVAHEAQKVAPYCVTGEKDAVDDDGNPIYQQMDHQVLVPLLIAEIQQLRARVAALEAS
jgi:predicted aspartyl protease